MNETYIWTEGQPVTVAVPAAILGRSLQTSLQAVGSAQVVSTPRKIGAPATDELRLHRGTKIRGYQLKLAEDLALTVEYADQGVLVRSPELGEDGYGATWPLALDDFLSSLADRRESLESRSDRIDEQDQAMLDRLQRLLEPA